MTYAYDNENLLTKVTDGDGKTTSYTYDAVGNELSQTNPNGDTTRYTYDGINRKITATESMGGNVSRTNIFTYDQLGNLTKDVQKHDGFPLLILIPFSHIEKNFLKCIEACSLKNTFLWFELELV